MEVSERHNQSEYHCINYSEEAPQMKFKRISIILALAFVLAHSPASEPFRAGVDVPEPKLIRKVEIDYPDIVSNAFAGNGPVVLDILVNEQGFVTNATERIYDAQVLEAVKAAVKQWRFFPTYVHGKAVPVSSTVVILFALQDTPHLIDLANKGRHALVPPGNICFFPVIMDHKGNLQEAAEGNFLMERRLPDGTLKKITRREFCDEQQARYYSLIPAVDAPFSSIEKRMKAEVPNTLYVLRTPRYRFPNFAPLEYASPGYERLYYSAFLVSSGSQLIQLAGVDPDVQPPKFDIDFDRLAEYLKDSRYKNGVIHFITVFVDDDGNIMGIKGSYGENKTVLESLRKAIVLSPGTRNGKPVPTAVIVAIPVR
jgi:hypothetical protein